VRRGSILAAKTLTSIVIGVVSMSVLVLATSLLLGAEWGDPVGVAVLVTSGVLAATAVTALVASLARTQEQAGNWQSIVALVLGMLGGAFFPVSQAGGLLATLSLATPHAWFLRGLGDLSAGEGPGSVLGAAGAMLLFAGIAGGLAVLRIGRLVRP
jgi:ABC-2 type transport system permease protein